MLHWRLSLPSDTISHPWISQLSKLYSNQPVTDCHRGNEILDSSADWCLWHANYDLWGGQNAQVHMKKRKTWGTNAKFDYNYSISTEFMRPLPVSTWHRQLGRNSLEKQVFCWTSECALRCDLICVRSSWMVAIVLRPSAPERAMRSSFCLYDERGSTKNEMFEIKEKC